HGTSGVRQPAERTGGDATPVAPPRGREKCPPSACVAAPAPPAAARQSTRALEHRRVPHRGPPPRRTPALSELERRLSLRRTVCHTCRAGPAYPAPSVRIGRSDGPLYCSLGLASCRAVSS